MNHAHTVTAVRGFPRPLMAVMLLLALLSAASGNAFAQQAVSDAPAAAASPQVAPVVVDGATLLVVRGLASFPAGERAAPIRARIIAAARDPSVTPDQIRIVESEDALRKSTLARL